MLLPFFDWMNNLAVSRYIGESLWIYPLVQAIHLVFLALLAGAVLIVDIRLLGRGMTDQPLAQVARDARPWVIWALLGMVATGVPQLMQNASREYYSEFFWYKMYALTAAVIFTFTIRHRVTQAAETTAGAIWRRVVALTSLALWATVAINGRLIGLFS